MFLIVVFITVVKILYVSDDYGKEVCGIKWSLYQELIKRGLDVTWKHIYNDTINKDIVEGIKACQYTHVFMAHSTINYVECGLEEINDLGTVVFGFGFSDPTYWNLDKLQKYNFYATNSYRVYLESFEVHPCIYFPTCCDISFHRKLDSEKDIDVLFYGIGNHHQHVPVNFRQQVIRELKDKLPDIKIAVYGNGWDDDIGASPHMVGDEFINVINRSKIGIDISQSGVALGRRNFEMAACGIPVIARPSDDIVRLFGDNIMIWETTDELIYKIRDLLNNQDKRLRIADQLYFYVRENHNISNRVDDLLYFLNGHNSKYFSTSISHS